MSSTVVVEEDEIRRLFGELRSCIRIERRCVADELEAFQAFRDRVEGVSPSKPIRVDSRPQSVQHRQTLGLNTVRDEYESTVMSVPHYDEEYDDSYEESVVEEFGPEVGFLLTEGSCFDSRLKQALLDRAQQCQSEREGLLRTLDIESESVTEVEEEISPVVAELQSFSTERSLQENYEVIEAEWSRLDVLSNKVNQIATHRQRAINRQRREFKIGIDAPDIATYLYQGFEDRYPLLSVLVDVERRIQAFHSEREQTLSEV
jgi:hypothetical protein